MFYRRAGIRHTRYQDERQLFPLAFDRGLILAVLALLLAAPLLLDRLYLSSYLLPWLLWTSAALGLNLLMGWAGQIHLGYGAVMGIGAYGSVHLVRAGVPLEFAMIAGGVLSAGIGTVFGAAALRMKGIYLAMATLAMQYVVDFVISHSSAISGGSLATLQVPPVRFLGIPLHGDVPTYYFAFGLCALLTLFMLNVRRTSFGRALAALREKDYAAQILGISVFRFKLLAFWVSSFIGGVVGSALAVTYLRAISPDQFHIELSIQVLAMIIVGGLGSVLGPFFGTALILFAPIVLNNALGSVASALGGDMPMDLRAHLPLVAYGALVVGFLLYEPLGLAKIYANMRNYLLVWPFRHASGDVSEDQERAGGNSMSIDRRSFTKAGLASLALPLAGLRPALAQEKIIRFSMPQDFTKIYTFVTSEYSQGQRDYITLVNDRGGVGGYKIVADVTDHANDLPRAIEAYERGKREGAVLIDPLSTPVARALVPRALEDKINLITAYSGRSDAADGTTFPYVLPLSINYWTQAGLIIANFKQMEKGSLKGKKIAFIHIDTPFGKEPLPILNVLAQKEGYELVAFPYTPPGNDQSAIWPQVRRARPDFVIFWGAGVGQTVALTEAMRNGLPMDRVSGSVWLSESDMDVVGRAGAKGVMKIEPCVGGREPKVIKDILAEVVGKGKGAGPEPKVGTAYYNYGVQMATLMIEGVRKAIEKAPNGPVTGPWLNAGLTAISNFTADGFLPPTTITPQDHQGGGMGRVARWDGNRFVPVTDWFTANQDVVWEEIRKNSEEFKKSGK